MFDFDDDLIYALIKGVFDGTITKNDLPEDLYHSIAGFLKKGLYKGFGGSLKDFDYGTSDFELLAELRENIYMFSGAKTYQQVREMTDALVDEDGNLRSFGKFKEEAEAIFERYNKSWLETEYDTAIGQGQNAAQWNDIEKTKELFPTITYHATEDENLCEICGPMDGVTAPVDDPIWDTVYPSNHFNCRCFVEKNDKYDEIENTPDRDEIADRIGDKMDDMFKMNPGKDRVIFNETHGYFDVEKGDKGFAKDNFDLPIPEKD